MLVAAICVVLIVCLGAKGTCQSIQCYTCDDCHKINDSLLLPCPMKTLSVASTTEGSATVASTEPKLTTLAENAPVEKIGEGQIPVPAVATEPTAAEVEEQSVEEVPADEVPAEEVPAEEVSADEVLADEAPAEEVPTDDAPAEEVPAEEVPAEEVPSDEVPAKEVPAEEDPADEDPAEKNPAEGDPAEEVPADEDPAEDDAAEPTKRRKRHVTEPPVTHQCFSLLTGRGEKKKISRGCVEVPANQSACSVLKDRSGVALKKCLSCSYNKCNGASVLEFSLITLLIVLLNRLV